ncbi:hypothetical protein [Sphingopyxis sp. 2PD]|uniref:hypothetical protein n=1 Tax=Sphingopyxis sp. 2PD TaxID=2502196 RepID=UPI0010F630A5|nr:hypothetical protein [Sphingopyxis sp. 2PD]
MTKVVKRWRLPASRFPCDAASAKRRALSLVDPLRPQEEPIWAFYPKRRHLLPKVRLLIDKLREELPGALRRSEVA